MILREGHMRHTQLTERIDAQHVFRRPFDRCDRWQQQGYQHRDDGDRHQQLDEGESIALSVKADAFTARGR